MINQIWIRLVLLLLLRLLLRSSTCGRGGKYRSGERGDGVERRTLYSSSDLERGGQFVNKDQSDNSWEEDPEAVRENVEEDKGVPIVVACFAPAAAVVLDTRQTNFSDVSNLYNDSL